MRTIGAAALGVLLLSAAACTKDPARSVKIIDRPPESASLATPPASGPAAVAEPSAAPNEVAYPSPGAALEKSAASSAPARVVPEPAPVKDAASLPPVSTPAPASSPQSASSYTPVTTYPAENAVSEFVPKRATSAGPSWSPGFCPPEGENPPGPGDFAVRGPCEFQIKPALRCQSLGDDFIVALPRKGGEGASLVAYLNVEMYHGPGTYDGGQMFITVQTGNTVYRWSNDNVTTTVGPGEAFVTIAPARLDLEPLLVKCTTRIGPATNYQYQCVRGDAATGIESAPEMVSGTIQCLTRRAR